MLQPTLYEVGRLWSTGELLPEREAAFSAFCECVVTQLAEDQLRRLPLARSPLVLVMNAHGNRHTLGLRMATFLLRERGVNARALSPTPPLDQLRNVLCEHQPAVVGVSLATDRHAAFLDQLLAIVATLEPRPRIVAGGSAVRGGCALPAGVEAWRAVEDLV